MSSNSKKPIKKNPVQLSVITPTHNSSQFIEKLLDSIPKDPAIEVVLVDDHSKDYDNLVKVVNGHKIASQIKILQNHQPNSAGTSRNIGLSKARGKWVVFADSDDYFSDNFKQIINRYKNSSHDVILFQPKSITAESIEPSSRIRYLEFCFREYTNGVITKETLSFRLTPIWSKIYRRSKIKKAVFKSTKVANDVFWSIQAAFYTRKNIHVDTDAHLYNVVEREGSITRTKKRNLGRMSRRVIERVLSDLWLMDNIRKHDKRLVIIDRHKSVFRKLYM